MHCYVEITIKDMPEILPSLIMNKIFNKLHKVLATDGKDDIGISFPNAFKTVGTTLRLHGSNESLQHLINHSWINGLEDYAVFSEILSIPSTCSYRIVKRRQFKSNKERLYRRSLKKGWISEEEFQTRVKAETDQVSKLPFLQLDSQSTGQRFRLFIDQSEISEIPVSGSFSSYGLSNEATIPWF